MIGIAPNLIPQYKNLMKDKISDDYFEKNKVDVYAPELVQANVSNEWTKMYSRGGPKSAMLVKPLSDSIGRCQLG